MVSQDHGRDMWHPSALHRHVNIPQCIPMDDLVDTLADCLADRVADRLDT